MQQYSKRPNLRIQGISEYLRGVNVNVKLIDIVNNKKLMHISRPIARMTWNDTIDSDAQWTARQSRESPLFVSAASAVEIM